jgi:hypothetical protein
MRSRWCCFASDAPVYPIPVSSHQQARRIDLDWVCGGQVWAQLGALAAAVTPIMCVLNSWSRRFETHRPRVLAAICPVGKWHYSPASWLYFEQLDRPAVTPKDSLSTECAGLSRRVTGRSTGKPKGLPVNQTIAARPRGASIDAATQVRR